MNLSKFLFFRNLKWHSKGKYLLYFGSKNIYWASGGNIEDGIREDNGRNRNRSTMMEWFTNDGSQKEENVSELPLNK